MIHLKSRVDRDLRRWLLRVKYSNLWDRTCVSVCAHERGGGDKNFNGTFDVYAGSLRTYVRLGTRERARARSQ